MLECPFETISCSWPRPVTRENECWVSEPEWQAPPMPVLPHAYLEYLHDEWYWTFHWNDFFRLDIPANIRRNSQMRDFHIIIHIRIKTDGYLIVRDDDGCIIRRGEQILHCNRKSQQASWAKIEVTAGEELEVAQWHHTGLWVWGAYIVSSGHARFTSHPLNTLVPYLQQVQRRLGHPNGPPLKLYTSGRGQIRTIAGIYSLILRGYVPSAIYVFGDYQWPRQTREFLLKLLPFATLVPVPQVLKHVRSIGSTELVDYATHYQFVMKTVIELLYPPHEFCMMDDDVFILDRLDDALDAFKTHNFVYTTNYEHGEAYLEVWGKITQATPGETLPTGNLNAGLYWLRNTRDPRSLAEYMRQVPPGSVLPQNWEQGLMAVTYADESHLELPSQRYYMPAADGLPGGLLGYDYASNPCGFASVHFAGSSKPSDGRVLHLMPHILGSTSTG